MPNPVFQENMSILEKIFSCITFVFDVVYRILLTYAKVVLLVIIVIVSAQVFSRKFIGTSIRWSEEVALLLMVWLAFIAMAIFNACGITITNSIAKMILGGGLLHFSPTPAIIISTFIIAILGSVLSNLYPVSSALRITPLKALAKGSE